ncbi:hypothetical protein DMB95_09330 [Campylobacter sp. MIT 12-8780]|uniref:hypothetical protein n=1 Tax=Campylobacter sp. MIT 12-8780 TaxID=2202200 RepID=UPI0010F791DF|nr:hypothetical protein [Campylobacter sp. MIT 12-8780]TKX28276.1 hypothetical protein CQA38_08500 [Campylobacter sp. MIT 12-5580]TQR39982.1 hypothetical protein DMB95_09330 [Campylobacter sp. MIT 12-8780]
MKNKNSYFNVQIDKNNDEEFLYLLEKAPYTSEEEIGELFSHLAVLDEVQKEKDASNAKISNKVLKFSFLYNDNEGAKVENLQVPLGQGHFTKGINHLRKIGKQDWEKDIKTKQFDEELSKKFDKFLMKPPAMDVISKGSLGTLQKCAKILDTIPSPEFQTFLQGFMNGNEKCRIQLFGNKEDQKAENNLEQKQENKSNEQEKSKADKIAEIQKEVQTSTQKKSKSALKISREVNKERDIQLNK